MPVLHPICMAIPMSLSQRTGQQAQRALVSYLLGALLPHKVPGHAQRVLVERDDLPVQQDAPLLRRQQAAQRAQPSAAARGMLLAPVAVLGWGSAACCRLEQLQQLPRSGMLLSPGGLTASRDGSQQSLGLVRYHRRPASDTQRLRLPKASPDRACTGGRCTRLHVYA